MQLRFRPEPNKYWRPRLCRTDVMHVDTFLYLPGDNLAVFRMVITSGGKGDTVRQYVFVAERLSTEPPKSVPSNHTLVTDLELLDPVRANSIDRRATWGRWVTQYHHRYLRDLATELPLGEYKRRSVKFHYFACPDHNPAQGFANFYQGKRPTQPVAGNWRDLL